MKVIVNGYRGGGDSAGERGIQILCGAEIITCDEAAQLMLCIKEAIGYVSEGDNSHQWILETMGND